MLKVGQSDLIYAKEAMYVSGGYTDLIYIFCRNPIKACLSGLLEIIFGLLFDPHMD